MRLSAKDCLTNLKSTNFVRKLAMRSLKIFVWSAKIAVVEFRA